MACRFRCFPLTFAATRIWRFRSTKLSTTTELDTKHYASFNHWTSNFLEVLLQRKNKCLSRSDNICKSLYFCQTVAKACVSTQLPPHSLSPDYVSAYTGGQKILLAYLAPQKIFAFKKSDKMCIGLLFFYFLCFFLFSFYCWFFIAFTNRFSIICHFG